MPRQNSEARSSAENINFITARSPNACGITFDRRRSSPFDHVATRQAGDDALMHFEGRQYSVPFAQVGGHVELRGAAGAMQILADQSIIAEHPRHTERCLVIDSVHYEGRSTRAVIAPTPLGRLGQRLQPRCDRGRTTNKAIRDWTELLAGDEALTAAILDRLLHKAHVLNIKGRSYRLRDLESTPGNQRS